MLLVYAVSISTWGFPSFKDLLSSPEIGTGGGIEESTPKFGLNGFDCAFAPEFYIPIPAKRLFMASFGPRFTPWFPLN